MKRITRPRWPAESLGLPPAPSPVAPPPRKSTYVRRGAKRRSLPTSCPVCGAPLTTVERIEDGPHGPEKVKGLACPNPDCPRPKF